ncbi:uncharacterized protein [Montipora foliosa]|uniref:uncharacterized protein n=1 Tax=Montipora foliosa TaxID=591990 RepID=UPI0035F12534
MSQKTKKTSNAVKTTEASEQAEKIEIDAKGTRSSPRLQRKLEKNKMETVGNLKNRAKEEIARSGKVYRKNTYPNFKRRMVKSYAETFFYNENAGPEWRGFESRRYSRYHIRKSMRFLEANMKCDHDEEQLEAKERHSGRGTERKGAGANKGGNQETPMVDRREVGRVPDSYDEDRRNTSSNFVSNLRTYPPCKQSLSFPKGRLKYRAKFHQCLETGQPR